MVTFADVHEVDPQVFRQGERAWLAMFNSLGERAAEVRRVNDTLASWEGEAATAAMATFHGHSQKLDACSDTLFEAYGSGARPPTVSGPRTAESLKALPNAASGA